MLCGVTGQVPPPDRAGKSICPITPFLIRWLSANGEAARKNTIHFLGQANLFLGRRKRSDGWKNDGRYGYRNRGCREQWRIR